MPQHAAAFDAIAFDSYPGYAEALPLYGLAKGGAFRQADPASRLSRITG
jgi:hypothetical protein